MSSFEWMELQTLTADIETARDRLADARKRRDQGRIRALEAENTQAEKRRLQPVAPIFTSIPPAPDPPPPKRKPAADGAGRSAPRGAPPLRRRQSAHKEARTCGSNYRLVISSARSASLACGVRKCWRVMPRS